MKDSIKFTENLIKGEIAQAIFEQMFIEIGTAVVIPFGYEHPFPVLAQFQRTMDQKDREDLVNVRNMPDFLLVSKKEDHAILVEVKYRKDKNKKVVKKLAKEICTRWPSSWLFLATQDGFYFGKCSELEKDGKIFSLRADWVPENRQQKYLELLKAYINF